MASVDQCMTQDPRRRWAINCTFTFECLLGYQSEGEKLFKCENGTWKPDEAIPSCKYRKIISGEKRTNYMNYVMRTK